MNTLLYWIKRIIPSVVLQKIRPLYHYSLSYIGSIVYNHPSKKIVVIAVTGTKGKSTTTELITAILEADGKKVASLSTIQFKIGGSIRPNLFKMTLPGRFFVQKFLREAVDEKCTHAVLEMTSEGARQFRHRFIEMDALVFTNLSPEHIESHGSFEKYKQAKLSIVKQLEISAKQPRYIVANTDDQYGREFLNFKVEDGIVWSIIDDHPLICGTS